jgi:hypothetical protein
MKLRLRQNSVRLRLTRTEVQRLAEGQAIEESVAFAPGDGSTFRYRVCSSAAISGGVATFQAGCVAVELPSSQVTSWATGTEEGIYFDTAWGIKVAVEKDFKCLDPRTEEDESDAFDHPGGASHCKV